LDIAEADKTFDLAGALKEGARFNGEMSLSPTYRIVWTTAVVIAVALMFTALIVSYLAELAAESPKCGGLSLVANYRTGVVDFFGFPLFCAVGYGALFFELQRVLKRPSTIESLQAADSVATFQFRSIRIGYGMSGFVVVLFAMFFMIGMTTGYCVIRYIAISSYCQLAAASS
jgi:hypothetical protein